MKIGFVYIWFDRKHKRYYVGCHWGREDDGYICSSRWMRNAYRRRPHDFKRRILSRCSDRRDLLEIEHRWLCLIPENELGIRYYNLTNKKFSHWAVDPESRLRVGQKISASPDRKENIRKALKARAARGECILQRPDVIEKKLAAVTGRVQPEAERKKRSESLKGHCCSEDTRKKIADAHRGKPKPPLSKEHKKKISEAGKGRIKPQSAKDAVSRAQKGKNAGTVHVTTITGINIRISKEQYDAQKIGDSSTWEFVSVTSKESKKRRLKV